MANVSEIGIIIANKARHNVRAGIQLVSNWFGALEPLRPFGNKSVAGRQRDYQIGENMVIRTRETGRVSTTMLRAFAENCDILRLVIESRKDQIEALEWEIVPADNNEKSKPGATPDPRIAELKKFFKKPDQRQSFGVWVRALLEDMFVIDAACVYLVRDRLDRLHSLELMDGSLIKVLNDGDGRVPFYPDPSYQAIHYGMPAVNYTTREIMYRPRVMRTWSQYGLGVVEQIIITVETQLNRSRFAANYYKDGNLPQGLIFGDTEMDNSQIEAFNAMLDDMLTGDLEKRRKILTIPGSRGKFQMIKENPMMDAFDEWLARIICYAFSVSPQPFVKQMNRATAGTAQEVAAAEGLRPIIQWLEAWFNDIIEQEFGYDDLVFSFKTQQDMDPAAAATIRASDVKNGIITPDEARESIGLEARGGAADELGVVTMQGFTPLQMAVDQMQQVNDAKVEAIKNPPPVMTEKPLKSALSKALGSKKKNLYHSIAHHSHNHVNELTER